MNNYQYGNYPYNPNFFNNQISQYSQPASILKGKIVSSVEEARSAIIDMDGSTTFFPCPANGCIYAKTIDLNGNMIFNVFKLVREPIQDPTSVQLTNLSARVGAIENFLKGASKNEPADADATPANVRKQS